MEEIECGEGRTKSLLVVPTHADLARYIEKKERTTNRWVRFKRRFKHDF